MIVHHLHMQHWYLSLMLDLNIHILYHESLDYEDHKTLIYYITGQFLSVEVFSVVATDQIIWSMWSAS
jgi:hypothetical protein